MYVNEEGVIGMCTQIWRNPSEMKRAILSLTSRGMRVCFSRRIFARHITHLNGKSLWDTAICIVLTKQRLQNGGYEANVTNAKTS